MNNSNNKNIYLYLVAIILLIALGFVSFLIWEELQNNESDSDDNTSTSSSSSSSLQVDSQSQESSIDQTSSLNPDLPDPNPDLIVISGFNFGYEPSTITVEAGQEVAIRFDNEGGTHDLVFEDIEARTQVINSGESEELRFTAPSVPGEYIFYCTVGRHRENGMEGVMIVE